MKELIVLLTRMTETQEALKNLGVHLHIGLKSQTPQRSLATKPMTKNMSSAEIILQTAIASAADGKISRSTLSADCRAQGLSGQMIGQGLRSLVLNKHLRYDKVSGIYKIL